MSIKLAKYYFDITSKEAIGFYYVISIQWGKIRLGASGIYYINSTDKFKSFKFSKNSLSTLRSLHLSNATVNISKNSCELLIDHKNIAVKGTWYPKALPLDRISKPFFQEGKYSCDWKVISPTSSVKLTVIIDGEKTDIEGSGYIDFVDFRFPFTRVPFSKLYWGRLHYNDDWYIFIFAKTKEKNISCCYYPNSRIDNVEVNIDYHKDGNIKTFQWIAKNKGKEIIFNIEAKRCLEKALLLNRNRFLNLLPKKLSEVISSSGYEKKYEVELSHENNCFTGIMEEVTWHE